MNSYQCPECQNKLFADDCDKSSHGIGCECRKDYFYCPNSECPERFKSIHKSQVAKAA